MIMNFDFSQVEGMIHQDLLPDCQPTRFDPTNLDIARRSPDAAPKYYASQLIGIDPEENPPLELLLKSDDDAGKSTSKLIDQLTSEQMKQLARMSHNAHSLIEAGDVCDKIGMLYIAKIFAFAQSSDANILVKSLVAGWNKNYHETLPKAVNGIIF